MPAHESAPPRSVAPKPTKRVRGPGRLLSKVLLFRTGPGSPDGPNYWAFFRTAGSFSTKGSDGTSVRPGDIWVGDANDDHDGFSPEGAGRPRGRCYGWDVYETPALQRVELGGSVDVTLRLHKTKGVQRRTPTLRAATHGFFNATFARRLARIGCRMQG